MCRHQSSPHTLCAIVCALTVCVAACGGEDGGGTQPKVLRAVQRMMDQAAWEQRVDESAALKALASEMTTPWQAAGRVEGGDGRSLVWAEYAPSAEAPRQEVITVFERCASAGECAAGKAVYTETGASWTDASGAPMGPLDLGEPVLHKTLKNHNLQKSETVLRLELNRSHVVDPALAKLQLGKTKFGSRRAVVLNAYGAGVGLGAEALIGALSSSGAFESVESIEFARRRDLIALLPSMSAHDVLIWVGAGVLEPFSDKPAKSVGMTLSRGVFGDELVHREHVAKLLEAPPLGGPGLVVLLGSNSLTQDHPEQTGLLGSYLHQAPHRVVVGVDGKLTPATLEQVGVSLMNALIQGKTLTEARGQAAAGASVQLTTMLTAEESDQWTLPKAKQAFWDKVPTGGQLKMFLQNAPTCVNLAPGDTCSVQGFKKGQAVPAEELTAAHVMFECDVTFDGPWMSCSSKVDATGTDFVLKGLLGGTTEGASILLQVTGAPTKKMKGVTAVGAGTILKRSDSGTKLTLQFGGPAAASTYTDAEGRCCVAKSPLLQGNQSQQSVLTIVR